MEGSAVSHRAGGWVRPQESGSGCLGREVAGPAWAIWAVRSFAVKVKQALLRLTGCALGIIFITCTFDSGIVSY